MKEETGALNDRWAKQIIDFLVKQGVDYFCVSPGSRSTALTLALSNHETAHSSVHFDERGTGFQALGYAKATGKPAAIITTSGTAVGNLFPAIMEASMSFTPLIILTADRPPELRDAGANQTLDQVKLFGNYVRFAVDLPCPSTSLSDSYLSSTIAQLVFMSKYAPKGPVHLNCMFREPIFGENPPFTLSPPTPHFETSDLHPSDKTIARWAKQLSQYSKGIIILGSLPHDTDHSSIEALSQKLGWPIFPDIFSGYRTGSQAIAHYDLILKSQPQLSVETILHFGDRLLSKTLLEWLKQNPLQRAFQVLDMPLRSDPAHLITDRLLCPPDAFCTALLPHLEEKPSSWIDMWMDYDQMVEDTISQSFEDSEQLSEPSLFYYLQESLEEKVALFLGNSMPVRDANLFLRKKDFGPIFGNRGVSGIDGNIATSVGIARGLKMPVIAVIGDLATLHDLNSLAMMKKALYPVILLVVNNYGGGIFSFLPVAKKKKPFEEFFATSHDISFEMAAQLFDLPYAKITQPDAFKTFFQQKIESSCVIEIQTSRQENFLLHEKLYSEVKQCFAPQPAAT